MSFAPFVLVVLPALAAFGGRAPVLRSRWFLFPAAAAVLAVLVAAFVRTGGERAAAERGALLLAAAVAVVLAVHRRRGGGLPRRLLLALLGTAAAGSVVVYLNFFRFHGDGNSVHYHDVAHYYLGSRYFSELGYTGLYTAMLRAEAEVFENHFATREARDLATNRIVDIVPLLQGSEPVKAAFTPDRWEDFKRDVAYFRTTLQGRYPDVLLDHGYNPTPFWTLVGGRAARLVPPGSGTGIFLLTLLDPLLLGVMFAAVAWAFGIEAMLVAVVFFCTCFEAGYPWLGGAFLRFPWLAAAVTGTCLLHRSRPVGAGILWAAAVLLRLFPVLFLAGPLLGAVLTRKGRDEARRIRSRFLVSVLASAAVLVLFTGTMPRGLGQWGEFRDNTAKYQKTIASNVVGLTSILAFTGPERVVTPAAFAALQDRRTVIYRVQLATVFLVVVFLFARAARRLPLLDSAALGTVLLFAGLNLAAYYYLFLILLLLAHRDRAEVAVMVLAGEALVRGCAAFEASQGVQTFYRSALILLLLAAVHGRVLFPGRGGTAAVRAR